MLDVELAAHNAWRIVCPNCIPQVLPVFIQAAIKLHILTVYLSGGCFFLHKQFGETFNVVDRAVRTDTAKLISTYSDYPHD